MLVDIPVEHDDGSDIYIDTSHTTTVRPVRHYPTSSMCLGPQIHRCSTLRLEDTLSM